MKQQVLKALANPAHIFYVPYSLAVLNFVIQFLIWIVLFIQLCSGSAFLPQPGFASYAASKSYVLFSVGDNCSFNYGDLFKTRPATGTDNYRKNSIVKT